MAGGPTGYTPMSLDDAVESHFDLNGGDKAKIRKRFEEQIRIKKAGAKCIACETMAVWAMGGSDLCFSCTTGEADASNDYEFEEVCF